MPDPLSWSELFRRRREAAREFGPLFGLPIVNRVRQVLLECVRDGDRVLEVGAGDRSLGEMLLATFRDITYQSLDIDPHGKHDFRAWSEVRTTYNVAFACEVVEHLPLEEIPDWLSRLATCLRPGGRLLLSTPNTYYPPAYLRDATHRTPLCYDELAGLVAASGLHVERIVRIYHDPLHRKFLRRYLFGWLFRLIGIDFARQIVLVARKP